MNEEIVELITKYNFANKVEKITKVTGGLSHRMYKVITDKGIYAVKELNNGIMKRSEAYSNFVFSEKVTDVAIVNGISAIGALKINEDIMKKVGNNHYMIFNWIDGKVLKSDEIEEKHCKIIGTILAQIHNLDFSKIEDNNRKNVDIEEYNWNEYVEQAKMQNKDYAKLLEDNCQMLYDLTKKSNEALKLAQNNLVISHTDLDRKNIMWQGDKPFIIDWEASGYINPSIELIQVAWYWSGGDIEKIDFNKYKIVIDAYMKNIKKKIDTNFETLVYADLSGGLAWLNYNIRRALCIDNKCEIDEIELAEKEIEGSIQEIKYNISQMDNILKILKGKKDD